MAAAKTAGVAVAVDPWMRISLVVMPEPLVGIITVAVAGTVIELAIGSWNLISLAVTIERVADC